MLKLTFLGTRGEIPLRSRRHWRHSALLIERGPARMMIDCGADWRGRLQRVAPTVILLTHAHHDHAAGLAAGAPCPVYAPRQTLCLLTRFPIDDRRTLPLRRAVDVEGIVCEAIPLFHSLRAPAVGYRLSAEGVSVFYAPDVAWLPRPHPTLSPCAIYIGDGATVTRSMVRRKDGKPIGHASIAAQLEWCAEAGLAQAIFTHCGSEIVRAGYRAARAAVQRLGQPLGIDAQIACDGDAVALGDCAAAA